MNILEVNGLKKKYTTNYVVNGISFEVNKGEILVFLGPNGAGKSTTINILSTALRATEGKIKFMGKYISENKSEYKSSLGIVPQSLAIFENIPAIENVKYFASFYGIKGEELKRKSEEALDMVGLLDRAKDLPKTYSGGMKRRLNIACALAHGPKLLILDEPTVGIDPQSRNHILESIKTLRKRGATIIYTTHYMEEVEAICDRVLIMDRGLVIAEGTLKELKESMEESTVYNISGEGIENIEKTFFDSIEGVNNVEVKDSLIVSTRKDSNNLDKIILKLINEKVKIKNIVTEEQNLETIFLNLTGRNLRN
ncbi:ABC transporter ATP-binding protein [Clostridium paraputrificum]|uniref:Antibiotic ABC transporter ATP-binding protein n=1 Tax=Clostridium paraputrificum TaxID=29363 RepID=A0A1B8RLC1_9CLOT|nr:ABC transporter ATP-binding protein [Clostridium paraputrificum]MDB2103416.1 ABC transporter ATP-binding protein [Clostridium paraputrificum]OBY09531.1 antibiotic ABC transporter ATP-binding protein [Clostridium paraputrificum]